MAAETKPCPFCAETIAVSAKKCRFCNEWLDGSDGSQLQYSWQGDYLALPFQSKDELLDMTFGMGDVAQTARLPSHACWICGAADQVAPKKKRFVYTPPWVFIGVLFWPILIVLMLVAQKRVRLAFPLCGSCRTRWLFFDIAFGLGALVLFFGFPIAGAALGSVIEKNNGPVFGMLAGFTAWIIFLIVMKLLSGRVQITAKRIETQLVTLAFPNPAVTKRVLASPGD